jgi:hypothetical protein
LTSPRTEVGDHGRVRNDLEVVSANRRSTFGLYRDWTSCRILWNDYSQLSSRRGNNHGGCLAAAVLRRACEANGVASRRAAVEAFAVDCDGLAGMSHGRRQRSNYWWKQNSTECVITRVSNDNRARSCDRDTARFGKTSDAPGAIGGATFTGAREGNNSQGSTVRCEDRIDRTNQRVDRVCDDELARAVKDNARRFGKVRLISGAVSKPASTARYRKRSSALVQPPDAMVTGISQVNKNSGAISCYSREPIEPRNRGVARPNGAIARQRTHLAITNDPHSGVTGICNVNVTLIVDRNAVWSIETRLVGWAIYEPGRSIAG